MVNTNPCSKLAVNPILAKGVKKLDANMSLIILSFPRNTGKNIIVIDSATK